MEQNHASFSKHGISKKQIQSGPIGGWNKGRLNLKPYRSHILHTFIKSVFQSSKLVLGWLPPISQSGLWNLHLFHYLEKVIERVPFLWSNASEINTLKARMGQAYNLNNWEVVQGHQEEFKVFFAMECIWDQPGMHGTLVSRNKPKKKKLRN